MSTVTPQLAYPLLARPVRLGPRRLRNSVFQAPMSVCYAEHDGSVSRRMIEHYGRRAQGGVGMVVIENVAISQAGRQLPQQALISDERFLPGLAALASEIKRHGAVAVIQLVHAGRYAGPWECYDDARRLAPSAVPFPLPTGEVCPAEITREEIARSIEEFAAATALARRAGFDGVEIHGAQGMLVASFQSPRMNLRKDEYGGSFENRCRFPLEVVEAVTGAAGPELLVGYHLMSDELMPGGWTIEDGVRFARGLEGRGVHFVMPIASTFESLRAPDNLGLFGRHMFQHHLAVRLSQEIAIPVLANGRLGDPADAEGVLARGEAAAVGLARPLLSDPDWYVKAQAGRAADIRICRCDPPRCLMTQLTGSVCSAWSDQAQAAGYLGYAA